ncbi:hypothetical protein EDF69_002555 [Sphingomonas sp. JUb134]|nr:hypothetical protein [Sphingomonas sp. JUb134]
MLGALEQSEREALARLSPEMRPVETREPLGRVRAYRTG